MRNTTFIMSIFFISMLLFGGVLPGIAHSQVVNSYELKSILNEGAGGKDGTKKQYLVPSYLQVGDLVFFDSTFPPGRWNVRGFDHVAMYMGNDEFIGTMPNLVTHVAEINISNYSNFFVLHCVHPTFARVVNVTAVQRQNAVTWALSRIGDLYQTWDPRKCADPNASLITADQWYCSEIVWAAYYHQGIDIDQNGWKRDFPWFFPIFSSVSPQDIYDDNDVIHLS